MKLVKGELVLWVASRHDKFWGIVRAVRKNSVYLLSDSSGFWVPLDSIKPTTVEKVVRLYRRRWKHSAKRTRLGIEHAYKLHKSLR